jgi:hypothetical protein
LGGTRVTFGAETASAIAFGGGTIGRDRPELIENPDAARGLEHSLAEAMVTCLDTTASREDTAAQFRHAAIIRRFRAFTDERADEALFLPESCKAIGVNDRTLLLCCQEQFE